MKNYKQLADRFYRVSDDLNVYTPKNRLSINQGLPRIKTLDQSSAVRVSNALVSMLIGLAVIFILSVILHQLEIRVTEYARLTNIFRPTASASVQHTYRAEKVAQTYRTIEIAGGKAITFEVHFKNTGNRPWFRDGASPVELVTIEPVNRASQFYHRFWVNNVKPARLVQAQVSPGETGIFRFALQSPVKDGVYNEKFALLAKDLAWVEGGGLELPITVKTTVAPVVAIAPKPVTVASTTVKDEHPIEKKTAASTVATTVDPAVNYQAKPLSNAPWSTQLFLRSHQEARVPAGQEVTVRLGFRNLGTKTWTNEGKSFISLYTYAPAYRKSQFANNQWYSSQQVKMETAEVPPGAIGFFAVTFKAPIKTGRYVEQFRLAAEDAAWVNGGLTDIPIIVETGQEPAKVEVKPLPEQIKAEPVVIAKPIETSAPVKTITLTSTNLWGEVITNTINLSVNNASVNAATVDPTQDQQPAPNPSSTVDLPPVEEPTAVFTARISEPMLRVGLYKTTTPILVKANKQYQVRDGLGQILGAASPNEVTTIIYDFSQQKYFTTLSGQEHQALSWVRLEPVAENTIFEIISHEDRPAWNPSLNDNEFRGVLEVRFAERDQTLWVINELPMEQYLKGIAETSNPNPLEYLKTMAVAARTYALYHYTNNNKHVNRNFHVDSRYDQVYKGYGQEKRMPRLVEAVEATRGEIVTYQNELAITPYFSRSDGRTRDWTEVWGGSGYPWLKSVPTPYDQGNTLWGHGVGIAATDALGRARDGVDYRSMLKHYYLGTELIKYY